MFKKYKDLDYISCWFYKGAKYIQNINAFMAFVSTNSIVQGEQVSLLWPYIIKNKIEIFFAHKSFKWENNAKKNAAVIVIIIGLRNCSSKQKYIFDKQIKKQVNNINAYLINGSSTIIGRTKKSISNLPKMPKGNMPYDGGNLCLDATEKNKLLEEYPDSKKFIKRLVGAREYINSIDRWCIWIPNKSLNEALLIDPIKNRINNVKEMRLSSTDKSAHKLAERSHQFREFNTTTTNSIIIPLTTSERREYIPIGFLSSEYVITNAASVLYDSEPWLFGLISSKIHMVWMKTVAGRLKSDYRYSSDLVYNTFPFPNISEKQKEEITELVFNILDEREQHSEKTLAELYDPDKMPQGLKEAHHQLDLAIEKCYRNKPFESDEERLEYLFKLYEEMVKKESMTK